MEVEFDLKSEDLMAFQRYNWQGGPHPRGLRDHEGALTMTMICLVIGSTSLFFSLCVSPAAEWYMMTVPFAGLGTALALLGVIVYVRRTTPRLLLRAMTTGRNAEKFLGWRRLSIDAEALRTASEFGSSTHLWHGIAEIGTMPDHAFFYIDTTTAVIVPRRAFRDDLAFEEFLEAARRYSGLAGPARPSAK